MRVTGKEPGGVRRSLARFVVVLLLGGLVTTGQAAADPLPAGGTGFDRTRVLDLWHFGGPQVRDAAARALSGTDADIQAFLTGDLPRLQKTDARIGVNRMLAAGGPTVKDAAQQALDSTDDGALATFLKTGWRVPAGHDQRIRVDQIMAAGGPELRKAGQAALDAGTPEALQTFLRTGWQRPYETDLRIRVNQYLAGGGPEVRKSAQRALDAATAVAYNEFLDHDRAIAEARDQETATVAQLANAAKAAGEQAAQETQAAKDASARAVREADLAKEAAQAAAQASASAQGNAQLAASAAQQAADAANNAAAAAREAVSAANAASSAARVAANAAARAASAAARAGQAASRAYSAASAAATDAGQALQAHQAADAARTAALGAQEAAQAATHAGDAANAAKSAAQAASSAGTHAADAAQAAADASANAQAAGADAARARQAASTARAAAARATRAAHAAEVFAAASAAAAYTARDAANRAASDANAAAAAADAAAEHAGNAADAAQQATDHANAATTAAQAAVTAADQAKQVYDAARTAEAERLATETDQADQTALAAAAAVGQLAVADRWNATQAELRAAETNRLIAEAGAAGTDPALAVTDARKVALALAESGGEWTQAAALDALRGADAVALEFVHSGIAMAAGQDDRTTLRNLTATGTAKFTAAAEAALAGSDADVQAFLRTQDYPGRETDDRIAVNQVLAAAQTAGNAVVRGAAQRALDTGTDQALRQFLVTGQFSAAATDDRIKANQILAAATSGPELKAAAQVALDGTAGMLHQFLLVGQFKAAQRDQDSASHDAEVSSYLALAAQAAATASQNANEAQATAATARGAAEAASGYARQAQADAGRAADYARQAGESAQAAADSATRAAQSAATARNAAASAQQAARQAAQSATWATASAHQAAGFAADAYSSAHDAFLAAQQAGKDARQAADAARQAIDDATRKVNDARAAEAFRQANLCEQYRQIMPDVYTNCIHLITASDFEKGSLMLENGSMCELLYQHGSKVHNACLLDVLSPSFKQDQQLVITTAALDAATKYLTLLAAVEAGVLCAAFEPCGVLALSIVPEGTAFTSWMAVAGVDALAVSRLGALLEETGVEASATQSALADAAALLRLCVPNSFTGETPVLLADGTAKPIRDVRPGDAVRATDPRGARTAAEPVTRLITGRGLKHLVDVSVRGPHGTAAVSATADHPFWAGTGWVDAKDLRAGATLRTADGGAGVVTGVRTHDETTTVFNLTVRDLHTFYVLAGPTPVLVHNSGCEDIALGLETIGNDEFALAEFSFEVGASPHQEWSTDKFWFDHVLDALEDGTTRIHFNLDGIADPVAFADSGVGVNPVTGFGRLTAWELNEIRHTPEAWSRITFYRNGKAVPNPFG